MQEPHAQIQDLIEVSEDEETPPAQEQLVREEDRESKSEITTCCSIGVRDVVRFMRHSLKQAFVVVFACKLLLLLQYFS